MLLRKIFKVIFSMQKLKRIRNSALLKQMRLVPCIVCKRTPSDPDHVKTKGSGGPDEIWNLMSLCRRCHTEKHKIGLVTFSNKHESVMNWLLDHGWSLICGRWKNIK